MAFRRRIFRKLLLWLRKGITPQQLALTFTLGFTVGVIPLYGITFFLISLLAFALKLNFAAMQFAHYVVQPVQLVLIYPFLKLGDKLFKGGLMPESFAHLRELLRSDLWGTLGDFWFLYLSATLVWFIISIPVAILLYKGLLLLFNRYIPLRLRVVRNRAQ